MIALRALRSRHDTPCRDSEARCQSAPGRLRIRRAPGAERTIAGCTRHSLTVNSHFTRLAVRHPGDSFERLSLADRAACDRFINLAVRKSGESEQLAGMLSRSRGP